MAQLMIHIATSSDKLKATYEPLLEATLHSDP